MEDLDSLINKLKQVRQELPEVLGLTAESMAGTAKAVAQLTIENEAILGQYKDGVVPAAWFEGKELNARGTSFIAKKMESKNKTDQLTNWKEFRAAQGLQTDHVDLTFTGEMWRGLLPQPFQVDGNKYYSVLAHNNKDGQNKLNWNRQRYGDFISKALNTPDNKNLLTGIAQEEILRFLDKYLK